VESLTLPNHITFASYVNPPPLRSIIFTVNSSLLLSDMIPRLPLSVVFLGLLLQVISPCRHIWLFRSVSAFPPTLRRSSNSSDQLVISFYQKLKEQDSTTQNDNALINPMTRISWYAAEAIGSIFGRISSSKSIYEPRGFLSYRPSLIIPTLSSKISSVDLLVPPSTIQETLTRIQLDNDRCYFLSGQVDTLIYDPNCLFADPFVSFQGRDRFVNNLQNLNTFITRYDAKLISYNYEDNTYQVNTKIMVKLELNLPWKPILAWPWGVQYQINPSSNLIMVHRESWDIDPWEV